MAYHPEGVWGGVANERNGEDRSQAQEGSGPSRARPATSCCSYYYSCPCSQGQPSPGGLSLGTEIFLLFMFLIVLIPRTRSHSLTLLPIRRSFWLYFYGQIYPESSLSLSLFTLPFLELWAEPPSSLTLMTATVSASSFVLL